MGALGVHFKLAINLNDYCTALYHNHEKLAPEEITIFRESIGSRKGNPNLGFVIRVTSR